MPRRPPRRPDGPALPRDLDAQLRRALAEDRVTHDRTSAAVLPAGARVSADVVAQAPGVLSGSAVAERLAWLAGVRCTGRMRDGARLRPGSRAVRLEGDAAAVLGIERTLLNYLMHLSGVATQTRRAVAAAAGAFAVLGTRKTTPGLRDLEKAAIVHGGGRPHRRDLSDRLLVKNTHLAIVPLHAAVTRALARAHGREVEVEVRSLAQARTAIRAGARALLLDNRAPGPARALIAALERDGTRRGISIELSGGITPSTVARYRRTGADAVSLGSLTHSAPAVPFHLVVRRLPPR